MADNNLDIIEDPNAPKKDEGQGSQAPVGVAPEAPSGSTGTGAGPAAPSASNAKGGSGFVNLQNILNANKQGGQRLGNVVGSGITQASGDVNKSLGSAQQEFQQGSETGSLGGQKDIDARNAILSKISGYQAPEVNTVGQGPNAQAVAPASPISTEDISAFDKYRAGQYAGPQQLGGIDLLGQKANQTQEMGRNIGSVGGQQALLQQFVGQGQPNYGRGAQSLDQLLLGQGGAGQLQAARQSTLGLGNKVQGAEQSAEAQAQLAAANAAQFGQNTKDILGGYGGSATDNSLNKGLIGDVYTGLQQKLDPLNAANTNEYQSFQNRLKNNSLTMADLERVAPLLGGMESANSLFNLKNEDIAKAYSQGQNSLSSVADPTSYAKLNALRQLAGNPQGNPDLIADQIGNKKQAIQTDTSQFLPYMAKNDALRSATAADQLRANQLKYQLESDIDPTANELQAKLNALHEQQFLTQGENGEPGRVDNAARAQAYYDTLNPYVTDSRLANLNGGGQNGVGAYTPIQDMLTKMQRDPETGKITGFGGYTGQDGDGGSFYEQADPYTNNIMALLEGNAQRQQAETAQHLASTRSGLGATDTGISQFLNPDAQAEYRKQYDPYNQFKRIADQMRGTPVVGDKGGNMVTPIPGYSK